tara:strand:- start:2086 stop:2682 length:597 start_codon:yes stop_codon:yes gene_type:complete
MGLGIFIVPRGILKSKITSWKKRIEKELNGQPYTIHPPHLTIIHANIKKDKIAIREIKECVNELESFTLTVHHNNIFWDDLFTGGHTLSYNTENSECLNRIQKKLSAVFFKYKEDHEIPFPFKNNEQLYDSYLNYGFPFVGEHWIPHFTVSSLRVNKNHGIIQEFLLDKIDVSFKVKKVSVWKIDGNKHQMIDEFVLK